MGRSLGYIAFCLYVMCFVLFVMVKWHKGMGNYHGVILEAWFISSVNQCFSIVYVFA